MTVSLPDILIVDDAPANIELIGEALLPDYTVRVVINGPEALEIATSHSPPDLILLDIMMPEMDGYEVLRRLKQNRRTSEIPVIFITAKSEEEDETRGLAFGAVDYITKPFQLPVVKARVKTQIELKKHRDKLEEMVMARTAELNRANQKMKREITEREQAQEELQRTNQALQDSLSKLHTTQDHLIQSEKMAALGDLVAGVAHEISTPVGIGVTATSLLTIKTRNLAEMHESKAMTDAVMEKYLSTALEATHIIQTNLSRAANLITSFKQVGADQASQERRSFNLKNYLNTVLFSLQPKIKQGNHTIDIVCPDDILLSSYPGAFSQIITNLIVNSVAHGFEGIRRGKISFRVERSPEELMIVYTDNGKGMDAVCTERVFDPFYTTKRGRGGTGLGMHIVYNLVTQILGGRISCESQPGEGVTFRILLPSET